MPASLLREMSSQSGALEEQRALQIALELSKLGLNENEHNNETTNSGVDLLRSSRPTGLDNSAAMKKSANMTECVPVPSSEHVAEIVGRQGCKIKALRARTNTYIKTPVRGEEPVFVVTGRREDVACAKREILSAAEHFSQIRASRRNNNPVSGPPGPPSPTIPGQVTIQVRVPYRVVGLVVGPKGATIKRIQQHTHTYIVTPSRDKEPIFEVTGLPSNVDKARQEIESHIAMRTGGLLDANLSGMSGSLQALNNGSPPLEDNNNDFHSNGIDSEYTDSNGDLKLLGSVYKPPSTNSAFTSYKINRAYTSTSNLSHVQPCTQDNAIFNFPPGNATISNSKEYTSMNGIPSPPVNGFGVYDSDEGIGSPPFDPTPLPNANILWCDLVDGSGIPIFTPVTSTVSLPRSSSSSTAPCGASPPLTDAGGNSDHAAIRRIRSDPLSGGLAAMTAFAPLPNLNNKPTSSASASGSTSSSASPTGSTGSLNRRRACYLCTESDVVAALVPCGHNLFCMECAGVILAKPEAQRRCPVCKQVPTQAIRIFS